MPSLGDEWKINKELVTCMAEFTKIIGENIRKYRLLRGWTQAELAKRSEVPTSTLTSIENGSATRVEYFLKLAHALDTPIENLVPKGYIATNTSHQNTILKNISNTDLECIEELLNSNAISVLKHLIPLMNIADELDDEKKKMLKDIIVSILDDE